MMNRIILKNNRIIGAELNVQFYYDKKYNEVMARFAPLMITTSGRDLPRAKEMFKEAFELWVETINEDGDAKEVLKNMGWKFIRTEATIAQNKESIELPFLTDNAFRLNIPCVAWAN
jgi:hypothetical protein